MSDDENDEGGELYEGDPDQQENCVRAIPIPQFLPHFGKKENAHKFITPFDIDNPREGKEKGFVEIETVHLGNKTFRLRIPKQDQAEYFTFIVEYGDSKQKKKAKKISKPFTILFTGWLHLKGTVNLKDDSVTRELAYPFIKKLEFRDKDVKKEIKFNKVTAAQVHDKRFVLEYLLQNFPHKNKYYGTTSLELDLPRVLRDKLPVPFFELATYKDQNLSLSFVNFDKPDQNLKFKASVTTTPIRPEKIILSINESPGTEEKGNIWFKFDPHKNAKNKEKKVKKDVLEEPDPNEAAIFSEVDLGEKKEYFLDGDVKLTFTLLVKKENFFVDDEEKKKRKRQPINKSKTNKSKTSRSTNQSKTGRPQKTIRKNSARDEENQDFSENKFIEQLPFYIPNDHSVQVGKTLSFNSYYFIVLINNSRKSIILKIVNPRIDPIFFHFLMGVTNDDTTLDFCDQDFKFNIDYQEKQVYLDPDIIQKFDSGDKLSIIISEKQGVD